MNQFMYKKLKICMLFLCTNLCAEYKNFVIIVPSYNNQKWYKLNLDSILGQDYPYFKVIYINDASTDKTGELVQEYLQKYDINNKVIYIENKENKGALFNLYYTIHGCNDYEIIVMVDGDDWLTSPYVLSLLNETYQDENVWMTFGQYITNTNLRPGCCKAFTEEEIEKSDFRHIQWRTSHLRTFYSTLFKKIKKEDLLYKGQFLKVTWDYAMMYPMLEMAHERHRFIPSTLYVYNIYNPLNDFKLYGQEQTSLESYIQNKIPYRRLTTLEETL